MSTDSSVRTSSSSSGSEVSGGTSSTSEDTSRALSDYTMSTATLLHQIEAADLNKKALNAPDEDSKSRDRAAADLKEEIASLASLPKTRASWKVKLRFFVRSFCSVIILLILVNGIGFLLWFTSKSSTIAGSPVVYWALLVDFFIVAFLVIRLVLHEVLRFLNLFAAIRILYHVTHPFESDLVFLAVSVLTWIASRIILIDLTAAGEERVEKLFIVLVTMAVLFLGKRALVTTAEILALQESQPDMSAARFWDKVFEQVYRPRVESLRRYENRTDDDAFSWARPSWIQYVKLASIAERLRASKFKNLCKEEPSDQDVAGVSGLLRLSRRSAADLFEILYDKKIQGINLNAVMYRYPGSFGRLLFRTLSGNAKPDYDVTLEDIEQRIHVAFQQRNALLSNLSGRLLLKYVADQILRGIIGIVFVFLFLGAFDIDLLVLILPFTSLALAFSFSFASLVRDFVIALHMIFFVQPYDLGDIVVVGTEGPYRVEAVTVMTTVFRSLGGFRVNMPNARIADSTLQNHRRSRTVVNVFDYTLDSSITLGDLTALKAEFQEWLATQPKVYAEDSNVFCTENENDSKVRIRCVCEVRMSWQQRGPWQIAMSAARVQFMSLLKQHGIKFGTDYKLKEE